MRIAQIHNAYRWRGGEDTIVETEADLLESAGHQVARLYSTNPEARVRSSARLLLAPSNPFGARAVARQAQAWGAEVAHVHNTWFSTTPELFHRLADLRIPTVMTIQNYRLLCANGQLFRDGALCRDCVGRRPWPAVTHGCYRGSRAQSLFAAATIAVADARRTYELVSRFLVPSAFVKGVLVDAGLPAERITIRPNVVDDPGARPSAPSLSHRLLYAGRLSPEKGVGTLMDGWAASGLAEEGFSLDVIGDGPLAEELRSRHIPGVELRGWLGGAELRAEMHRARALLFPSEWYENFGRVIIEAMSCGLPVLASDIATPAEVVGRLGGRWLVQPGDVQAWADGLAALADDARVDEGGASARRSYEDRYTLALGLQSLLGVYREVVSAPGSPSDVIA